LVDDLRWFHDQIEGLDFPGIYLRALDAEVSQFLISMQWFKENRGACSLLIERSGGAVEVAQEYLVKLMPDGRFDRAAAAGALHLFDTEVVPWRNRKFATAVHGASTPKVGADGFLIEGYLGSI